MSHTGELEAPLILDRLKPLCGGRVYEGVPDDAELAFLPDGSVRPHVVVLFSDPIPTASDRSLGGNEAAQPHILPFSVSVVARDAATVRSVGAAIGQLLIGWVPPTDGNATEIHGRGSANYATPSTENKPTRWTRIRFLDTTINLAPDLSAYPSTTAYPSEAEFPSA